MPDAGPANPRHTELILQQVDSLPTLPAVAARLIRVSSVEDADFGEIIRLIQADPALTARLLSLCRRAELGLGSRVTTVERAVVLLGLDAIQAMVLGVYVFQWQADVDKGRGSADAGFDRPGFWRHSIGVACAAELIASANRSLGVRPGEAFVAGLLHDLGKLALDLVLPQAYQRAVQLAEHRQSDIADIERSLLGLDHHTAGKRLAERWQLPAMFRDAMWLHGQAFGALPEGPSKNLVALVTLADALCRSLHLGFSGNHAPARPLQALCAPIGVDHHAVEALAQAVLDSAAARCRDLGVCDQPGDRVMLDSLHAANKQLTALNAVMERRSRLWREQSATLGALASFNRRVRPEMSVLDILGEVSESLRAATRSGRCVLVYQASRGQPWMAASFDDDAQRTGAAIIDHGGVGQALRPTRAGTIVAQGASNHGQAQSGLPIPSDSMPDPSALARTNLPALLASLEQHLPGGAGWFDAGVVRVLPLLPAAGDEGAHGNPAHGAAALLHNGDRALSSLGKNQIEALGAAWGAALAFCAFHEDSRTLGEQLAGANRVLSQMQSELAAVQSMARLGELTAGAAHEMNSPLAVISARCQMLAGNCTDPAHRGAAQAAVQAAARLNSLVTRLHLIAKPPEARFAPAAITDIITEAIKRARDGSEQKAARAALLMIRVTIAERIPAARVDRELLTRALVEIIRNAIESKPREALEVRARIDPVEDHLVIEVTDTGCGMSEHALGHAFDPFFSEKSAGRQAGLGLATAAGLVRLHSGSITLESREGAGTTARIALPDWRWTQVAQSDAA